MAAFDLRTDTETLPAIERRQRSDAARNRARLLQAAADCFGESGLECGVSEIAERAGVGRATLFRNFPTKNDLVVAIVLERIQDAIETGEAMLANGEPHGALLTTVMADIAGRQQADRALFEAIGVDAFLDNPDIRTGHAKMIAVLDAIIARDVEAGTVRSDVSALDVLLLVKGACAVSVEMGGPEAQVALERQLGLARAALMAGAETAHPLAGQPLTIEEFERAHRCSA